MLRVLGLPNPSTINYLKAMEHTSGGASSQIQESPGGGGGVGGKAE